MNLDVERTLVLGATGWFGNEFLHLTEADRGATYCVASRPRDIEVAGVPHQVHGYDINEIEAFAPTVVIDCAGLNRHRQNKTTFLDECLSISVDYVLAMSLPSVKAGLTFSSGAAAFDPAGKQFDGYSASKVLHERLCEMTQAPSVVMRCYAVSGRLCKERKGYAMSSFIDMAKRKHIKVTANRPTFRRYMAIDDYMRVGLTQLGKRKVLDSAGWWVELGTLAQMIASRTGAKVSRPPVTEAVEQYGSNSQEVLRLATEHGIRVKDLSAQIEALL
jgi:hypothetical protein